MYRPPPQYVGSRGHHHHRPRGRGGHGRGFNLPSYPPQNPNHPFTSNPPFPQLPFPNPNFPSSFPQPSPLDRIEAAAAKAHRDLLASGRPVSAWTVAESARISLNADSWTSLGVQLHDVPTLRRLLAAEGKVNAFIHCFVGARRITTLYELEAAICKSEGIGRFEELGLGPLVRHPLVGQYFSVNADSIAEVFRITSEDIVAFLRVFIEKRKKGITADKFLDFLAQQKSVAVKEKLGVRIQSLGLHISCIREAKKAEEDVLSISLETMKPNTGKTKGSEGRVQPQLPVSLLEKQVLDKRFDLISERINSFSTAWDDFGGKHIRFDPDNDVDVSDDDNDDEDYLIASPNQGSCLDKDGGQRASSCPYPSTTEEMKRLGLKTETSEKVSVCNSHKSKNEGKKSSGKKRKLEAKIGNDLRKVLKKENCFEPKEIQDKVRNLTLASRDMETFARCDVDKFITTWKEACREHPVGEILDMMVNFYIKPSKKRKLIREDFLSYPGIGLLHVAVASMKCGMLDSLYDTFQTYGEHGFSSGSAPSAEILEIGPSVEVTNTNKGVVELAKSISVDEITEKVAEYFASNRLIQSEKDIFSGKKFSDLKKLYNCETWLTGQLSIKEFSSLGYGNFFDFLEKHALLIPSELHSFLSGELHKPSCMVVSMVDQQLKVLLSQVKSNFTDNAVVTKNDISALLKKQFPTLTFHVVGNEPEESFVDLTKRQKDSDIDNSNCVLFSTALLGKQPTGNSLVCSEKPSSDAAEMMSETTQQISFLSVSSKDAIECLLKAPMLSDLLSWSHWDLIYAPSLGPLLEWLSEVCVKEILCIATIDGKLIRIDHSATVDEFLEALIQRSPLQAPLKLLSLLSLYGGIRNAPLSLLKCYAHRAVDVIVKNSIGSVGVNTSGENAIHRSPLQQHVTFDEDYTANLLSVEASSHEVTVRQSLSSINRAVSDVSRFILECLGHLPREFWSFAAEILVSGLRSFTKDAPLVILHSCLDGPVQQRLMLHDIGLSLGITEWIEDYHKFCSTASTEMETISKREHLYSESVLEMGDTSDISERSITQKMLGSVKGVASSLEVSKRENSDFMGISHRKSFDEDSETEVHLEEPCHNSGKGEDNALQDAVQIVETIRREEFGLGPNLDYSDSSLLKKQHVRLGRALHCLSQELYSQDSHLLLELVQNADDNIYPEHVDPTLVFILQDTGIVVLNNERGFSARNIRALCDIGSSTKKGSSAGYIGHKGIGFKSVFRVTDAPEIHSNGFHVKFDITEGQIGFVLPTVTSPCDVNKFQHSLSCDDDTSNSAPWSTCILLPFRSDVRDGTGLKTLKSIISMFSDLHPSLLLFLHRLQCIKFRNMLTDKLVIMRRETLGNDIIKVSHGEEKMSWLVVRKNLRPENLQPSPSRQDVQTTEIAMAFTLQETENGEYKPLLRHQPVFAFLPLRNYGLKFILQGDFVLPSSREEVDGDSAWNQWLLSELPSLFVHALHSFCALPCFQKNQGRAVTAYMTFVPLVGEVNGFFSHLPHLIISKLRMSNCLLLDCPDSKWVLPCRVLRGWNEQGRSLLSDNLLQKYLGLGYLSKDIVLSDSLAKALGIQDYGPKVLVDILSAICRIDDGINSLGLDWLFSWLAALYSTFTVQSSCYSLSAGLEYDLINNLRRISFIPLSDGLYSSLAYGPIWLPCDSFSIGSDGKYSPNDFPGLYAKLRTVNPLLISATENTQETRVDNVIKMLRKIGVEPLSAHDVIKSHILVSLSDNTHANEDKSLIVEYLSFIMLHFQYPCASCHSDKADMISELRKKPILLTNDGYRCPSHEPVHFSKEYANSVDIGKMIDGTGIKWLELDVSYLKHPGIQSLSSGLVHWKNFFRELGVTDFVQVRHVDKNDPGTLYTVSGSIRDNGDVIVPVSFIRDWESTELVNLLSTFSSKEYREQCICLLEFLDKMWEDPHDCYGTKARCYIISETSECKTSFESSFLKSIHEFQWIASSMDKELHHSKDLFYDCEEVRSVLGSRAPYAVPKVTSKLLLNDIGFKTQVSFEDAMSILNSWRLSKAPFTASTVQMSKLYTCISDGIAQAKVKIAEEFTGSSFIFVPFPSSSRYNGVVSGQFFSPKELYWHDPTGCANKTQEMIHLCTSLEKTTSPACRALASVYPSLHDFFVNKCGVHDLPSFGSYIQILLQLSAVSLPSQSAHVVFLVLVKWADDLKSGLVKPEEICALKEKLSKLENTVLPTFQDKWVSLHPSFGTICWSDDEELRQQFKHSDGIDFLQFGELSNEDKNMLSGKVAVLFQNIGVPALSEIVSREAIIYGTEDNREKASLVNWVLPYAQRYIYKVYPDIYLKMKQLGFEKLNQLKVVIVEKLFYKYILKGRDNSSRKRSECSCLLQENILYATRISDSHSMFLELSRLFFNGLAELHFANFLHMVTTMAEFSTKEQIEIFIVSTQKVPELPDEEPIWSLSSLCELHEGEASRPSPADSEQKTSTSNRKPGISPSWPPRDWKTGPDFNYCRKTSLQTRSRPVLSKADTHAEDLQVPVEVDGNWIIQEGLKSANTLMLKDSETNFVQPQDVGSFESIKIQFNSGLEHGSALDVSVMVPGIDLPTFPERDIFFSQAASDNQTRKTGRDGEMIAYCFFVEKLGFSNVKWVNEETETGLPYDLITGVKEDSPEYVEVKSTRSSSKGWFEMSPREWQFAAERGDSFSIAHISFVGQNKASITLLKNPLKLCQKNELKLAVLMSRELCDTSSSATTYSVQWP